MKKKRVNHLICNLGLLVSTGMVKPSELKAAASDSPDARPLSTLWPIEHQFHHPIGLEDDFGLPVFSEESLSSDAGAEWDDDALLPGMPYSTPEAKPFALFPGRSVGHAGQTVYKENPEHLRDQPFQIQENVVGGRFYIPSETVFSDDSFVASNENESLPDVNVSPKLPGIARETSYSLPQLGRTHKDFPEISFVDERPFMSRTDPSALLEKYSISSGAIPDHSSLIAQEITTGTPKTVALTKKTGQSPQNKTILINFNNVGIIEYIRFISKISGKNFVFDENDLQFNVTIVSEEPTSIENIMTALIQELRIHDLTLLEQGNNLIIHKNSKVNSISKIVAEDIFDPNPQHMELVTQVFRLNTLDPEKTAAILRPLASEKALVETIKDPNYLIVTDVVTNVNQIGKLLKNLDSPNSGLVIGQYVAQMTDVEILVPLVHKLMTPISQDQSLIFVPYELSKSIFIVSTPFLVERSISILQHLDQDRGHTRIIDLGNPQDGAEQGGRSSVHLQSDLREGGPFAGTSFAPGAGGQAVPGSQSAEGAQGSPDRYAQGDMNGVVGDLNSGIREGTGGVSGARYPETPEQRATRERAQMVPPPVRVGISEAEFDELAPPETFVRNVPVNTDYIPRPSPRSKFYIHKLQYRKGDVISQQMQQVATSFMENPGHDELIATINSMQWLQDAKSLVFTGTPENLEKVKELVEQIDLPLRQVFIEMLILNTTLDESLNFSVSWGDRFGGGNVAGVEGFVAGTSNPLSTILNNSGVSGLGEAGAVGSVIAPDPSAAKVLAQPGFNLGIIGQHIIHKTLGIEFNSIAAIVNALHSRTEDNIIMSPKIITEDNVPAYIFVGETTPFQTQSVANALGQTITSNFEYRDVGISLQVTPHISNSDLITIDIVQEVSDITNNTVTTGLNNTVIAPTTTKNTTKTTVQIPDGFFVIISGLIKDQKVRSKSHVPCLGGTPLIGSALGASKTNTDTKRNLMIFIRPQIVDTDEDYQNITRHEQDIWKFKNSARKSWLYETEEALDFLNVKRTINTDDEDNLECSRYAH